MIRPRPSVVNRGGRRVVALTTTPGPHPHPRVFLSHPSSSSPGDGSLGPRGRAVSVGIIWYHPGGHSAGIVLEPVIDLNATAAYKRAGYKSTGNATESHAARMVRNGKGQAARLVAFGKVAAAIKTASAQRSATRERHRKVQRAVADLLASRFTRQQMMAFDNLETENSAARMLGFDGVRQGIQVGRQAGPMLRNVEVQAKLQAGLAEPEGLFRMLRKAKPKPKFSDRRQRDAGSDSGRL